jgi:ribose transport system permease protein
MSSIETTRAAEAATAPGQAAPTTPEAAAPEAPAEGSRRRFKKPSLSAGEAYALLAAWIFVVVLFSVLKPDTYFSSGNFQTIFGSQAVLLIVALGLVIPLTTGDFDLSIASNLSLCGMVVSILNVQHGVGIGLAILAGLGCSLLIGMINGTLVVGLGIDSFIVTLGTSTIALGVVQWISDSNTVTGVATSLSDWTLGNRLFGISVEFYYGVAACLVLFYIYEFTPLGRRMLFVGRGRSVARLSGLKVERIRWGAFVASALMAGAAGIVYAGNLAGADPSSGQAFLLPAFAAAYLGATAIQPGRFNPIGTFIAVYFLVSGITGLQLLGVASFVQQLFYGGALVLAVALSQWARSRSQARAAAR